MAPARTQHAATPVPVIFTRGIFTYDGDGKRVKSVESTSVGTTTTYFPSTSSGQAWAAISS